MEVEWRLAERVLVGRWGEVVDERVDCRGRGKGGVHGPHS